MDRPLPQNRFLRGIYLMIQRYLRHNVGIQSAALAFYLLFTLFPLMIFISALLGLLDLNVAGILEALPGDFAPGDPGIYRSVSHLRGGKPQSSAAALWAVLLAVFSHAGNQCSDALRAHGVPPGAAPAGRWPTSSKAFCIRCS